MFENFKKISVIYTTVASQIDAEKLAEDAVLSRHAACVNIIPSGLSVYVWNGKLDKSQECYLIFKTVSSKAEELFDWILKNHPYSCAAILKTDVETSPEFFHFVKKYSDL